MNNATFDIEGRAVGPAAPVFCVAELSANHHQRLDEALKLVDAAQAAGADAVKLQTYTPGTMTIDADAPAFRVGEGSIWAGRRLYDLYAEAQTPWDWYPRIAEHAVAAGLQCFSTPFDTTAVDFLERMGVPCYKIASFEIVDIPLLKRVGETGKPVILSTGMATLGEIEEAVQTLRGHGCPALALLKCVSAYPADVGEMHLRSLPQLAATFQAPAGLSDHTLDHTCAIAAVALGACIVEKHLTMSRETPGPDSAFSLEPHEFKELVRVIRQTERAMGMVRFGPAKQEAPSQIFRRSLFVTQDIKKGEAFTPENVRSIRPGHGLHTRHLDEILRRHAAQDIVKGTPLRWDLVS